MQANKARNLVFAIGLTLSSVLGPAGDLWASETLVTSLSEGACWLEQSDSLKIVSFNDHQALTAPREGLEETIHELMGKKTREDMDMMLHCGGQGASLVVKTADTCAWFKLSVGKLAIRSLGGIEHTKRGLCDGFKRGELIVGVESDDEFQLINSHPAILSASKVTMKVYKVLLKKEYAGSELELIKEIKASSKFIRYVELNSFQHPVGEYVRLK